MNKHTSVFFRKSAKALSHDYDQFKLRWNDTPKPERGALRVSIQHVIKCGINGVPEHEMRRVLNFVDERRSAFALLSEKRSLANFPN